MEIQGALSAIVTPFTADGGAVDEQPLRDLVDRTIDAGGDGIVACGGTGEFIALSAEERRRVIEIVCDQASGRVAVVAQTGGLSTREAIAHSRHAEQAGADALMVAPPFYEPLNDDQAYRYFGAIAGAVELPIMLYNYPHGTGLSLSAGFIRRMATEFDGIRYVKDSSADLVLLAELVTNHREAVGTFCGEDVLVGPALLAGARGLVTGSVNFMMPVHVRLVQAAAAADSETVVRIWQDTLPLITFLATHPYTSAVKTGCELIGHPVGPVREPLPALTADARAQLESHIKRLDPAYFA